MHSLNLHYLTVLTIVPLLCFTVIYFINKKSNLGDTIKRNGSILIVILLTAFIWYVPGVDDGEMTCHELGLVDKVTSDGFIYRGLEYKYSKSVKVGDYVCVRGDVLIKTPRLYLRGWSWDTKPYSLNLPIKE